MTVVPVTVAQFTTDFPEFSNATTYLATTIQFWITVAASQVNPQRWQGLTGQGQELLTAHYVSLAAKDQAAAARGVVPGQVGVLSSKAAGPVSGSYDTTLGALEDGGELNTTTYGRRYLRLLRMMGAGGMQVNAPPVQVPVPNVFPFGWPYG